MTELKRKTLKLSQPNPLFEKWLQEWKDEAASRNSDTQYAFAKAIKSLKKYPLPLKTGKECMILEHFGTRICLLLDRKLSDYKKHHANSDDSDIGYKCQEESREGKINKPRKTAAKPKVCSDLNDVGEIPQKTNELAEMKMPRQSPTKSKSSSPQKKNDKIYIPTLRSSSYAVLVALYIHLNKSGPPGEMAKEELQRASQPLCDTSMWKPLPGSYYSGWSCVGQLVSKGLLQRKGNPHRYSLTEDGIHLAEKLPVIEMNTNISTSNDRDKNKSRIVNNENTKHAIRKSSKNDRCNKNDVTEEVQAIIQPRLEEYLSCEKDSQSQSSTTTSNSNYEQIILLQGQFEIILLIDTQEIHRGDELVKAVQALGVNLEVRKLKVGDFAWISRNSEGQELLLPYIVERKRLDDLASSIKDGRFHEQKFRMKQSGVPNCMYLVEGCGQRQFRLPVSTLLQAAVNTQFIDRFSVKYTGNFHETVVYLTNFTKILTRKFSNKTLLGCQKHLLPEFDIQEDCISLMSFKEFSKLSNKTRKYSVKEMFIKHLVQLRGLSVEKALAIVERYPSPRSLARAFENEGNEKFLSDITVGNLNRKMGPAISKAVYELYSKLNLN